MRVDISQLFGHRGKSIPIDLSIDINDTEGYPDVVGFLEPVKIKGTLTNIDDIIVLDAEGDTLLNVSCSRCLAPVNVKLNFKLYEMFSKTGNIDEDIEAVTEDSIDLYPYVRNEVFENIPMKIVCKDDCKGLCPSCGKNLNEGNCDCDTSYINPKFDSLRALFNVDEEV
ncbi:YceD family protein [Tyzzerella sp. An114]|uniref:YceD family protein n=1 Tax=Tyzzerella sp. An114 TaxID=1965545 RepID=UPI001302118C|nr:DUF177 domain-containing protein [Tyzzerella sp. An114]